MGRTKWDWAGFDHLSWVFDHSSRGSCHLKEGEQRGRKKIFAMESVNSLRISAPQWWPLREGRDGKCEGRNEKCKFLARESVSSSPMASIHLYFARKQVGDNQKRGKPEMRSSCRKSLDLHWSASARPGRGPASVPHLRYLSVSRHFNE